ncbi:hypothetical protein Cpir12675_004728 [Ceratocystis pirilliformis]|uniref:Uncharacterized protein n=1 Tax=Ceratocystis pirilliformis TaxID=259994 RepID=A0ABR3YXI3_9PEZI
MKLSTIFSVFSAASLTAATSIIAYTGTAPSGPSPTTFSSSRGGYSYSVSTDDPNVRMYPTCIMIRAIYYCTESEVDSDELYLIAIGQLQDFELDSDTISGPVTTAASNAPAPTVIVGYQPVQVAQHDSCIFFNGWVCNEDPVHGSEDADEVAAVRQASANLFAANAELVSSGDSSVPDVTSTDTDESDDEDIEVDPKPTVLPRDEEASNSGRLCGRCSKCKCAKNGAAAATGAYGTGVAHPTGTGIAYPTGTGAINPSGSGVGATDVPTSGAKQLAVPLAGLMIAALAL